MGVERLPVNPVPPERIQRSLGSIFGLNILIYVYISQKIIFVVYTCAKQNEE